MDQTKAISDKSDSLCLVVPTFNEEENISKLISRINTIKPDIPFALTVVVVDDHSSDKTKETVIDLASKLSYLRLIERPSLLGIGSAYIDGFSYGLAEIGSDYFAEIDADLQHPPEVLVQMCEAAKEGVDVIIASRYAKGGGSEGWSLGRRIVSRGANFLTKIFIRAPVADSTSGFRMMSSRAIRSLLESEISSKGYSFQIESLYVYKKSKMTFCEVPYVFEERKSGETKLRFKETLRFAMVTIKLGIFGMSLRKEQTNQSY